MPDGAGPVRNNFDDFREVKESLQDVSRSIRKLVSDHETRIDRGAPMWISYLMLLLLALLSFASVGAYFWARPRIDQFLATLVAMGQQEESPQQQLVLRPVQRQETYTVRRPIHETVMKDEEYTERRPVRETTMREEEYTVQRPVYETEDRQEYRTVKKPVHHTTYRDEYVTVNEPVITWQRQLQTDWFGVSQWVLVPVTTYVPRTEVRRVPEQTVEYQDVIETRKVPVQTVRYVDETKTRKVPVEITRYVEETKTRKVPVEVTRYVDEERTRWVTDYVSSTDPPTAGSEANTNTPADEAPALSNGNEARNNDSL